MPTMERRGAQNGEAMHTESTSVNEPPESNECIRFSDGSESSHRCLSPGPTMQFAQSDHARASAAGANRSRYPPAERLDRAFLQVLTLPKESILKADEQEKHQRAKKRVAAKKPQ